MKILLAGKLPAAMVLLRALAHSSNHKITHCADGARAIVDLLNKEYDWAIIDGHSVSGGETDVARIVRAMGPVTRKRTENPADQPGCPATQPACGVEWSKDGILQLHCCLHTLLKNAGTSTGTSLDDVEGIIFEYHAPCAKTGRRSNG